MVPTPAGIESASSRSPEVPRPAINKSIRLFDILSYERIHYTPFNLSQINSVGAHENRLDEVAFWWVPAVCVFVQSRGGVVHGL